VTPEEHEEYAEELAWLTQHRPKVREDCEDGPRPCPFVGCRYNLFLDVTVGGNLKMTADDPGDIHPKWSCVLDVAERGPLPLEDIGDLLCVTKERVRQLEAAGLDALTDAGVLTPEERYYAKRAGRKRFRREREQQRRRAASAP
jgi:hypothetical protein